MGSNNVNFFRIFQMLNKETDEEHLLTMSELIERLRKSTGDKLTDRTIRGYIKALQELGYDISDYKDNGKGYYLRDRIFEEHEIRLLIDQVTACRSITHDKTRILLSKLEQLTNRYMWERLKGQLYIENRSKACNEQIFYNIDKLQRAIDTNRNISFKYCHYNMDKQLVPKQENGRDKIYTISPVFMILMQDSYYLVTVSDKYEEAIHFRIDRMQMVEILENEERRDYREVQDFQGCDDAATYAKMCTRMYAGKKMKIVLKLKDNLLDLVIDEFGEDVELSRAEEGYFIAGFTTKLSEGLKRWILQLGSKVKVLEPECLANDIKEEFEKCREIY